MAGTLTKDRSLTDAAVNMAIGQAGLVLVSPESLTIRRQQDRDGFVYVHGNGRVVKDKRLIRRLNALAVPPAYEDVWLASEAYAHLQAIGRDQAGRLQYRYHPKWDIVREELKVERLAAALRALPAIRARVSRDLSRRSLERDKALAAAVMLIDATHMRVGCDQYARKNRSFGISTLLRRHVSIGREVIGLSFRGKGGKDITCQVRSAPLARALRRMSELSGQRLLKYRNAEGKVRAISAADVNRYLADIAGEAVTAKDLRMLGACAAAARQLVEIDPAESESRRKRQVAEVMRGVSERLANTPAIVRKSYVHAVVVEGFASGRLRKAFDRARAGQGVRRVERALRLLVEAAE